MEHPSGVSLRQPRLGAAERLDVKRTLAWLPAVAVLAQPRASCRDLRRSDPDGHDQAHGKALSPLINLTDEAQSVTARRQNKAASWGKGSLMLHLI
jgi:hypothetical protein